MVTVNVHKGFNRPDRRLALRELCEALRQANVDLVFLQEIGRGSRRCVREDDRETVDDVHQHQYLAGQIWPGLAYGRNAVYAVSEWALGASISG